MLSKEIMMVIILLLLGLIILLIKHISEFTNSLSLLSNKYGKLVEGSFELKKVKGVKKKLDKINVIMEDTLKNSEEQLKEANELSARLKSVLKGTSNGIIAIDNEENVMIINSVAKEVLRCCNEVEPLTLERVVKNQSLLSEIRTRIYMPKEITSKIFCSEGHCYRIEVNRIKMQKKQNEEGFHIGKVINISDVTEKHKLEELRTAFVTSVTHELKTPVTSIIGFVEALKENPQIDEATRNRFLNIIEEESNRLSEMIDDILTLSFVENNEVDYQKVEIKPLIEQAVELLKSNAIKKNIKILVEVREEHRVITNRNYLYQILINLMENAIKYSDQGKQVEISCYEEKGKIKIKIKDQGSGIALAEQNRIFERFYRVDKSRSGKERGTGLGLAIVKHMAMAIEAVVEVESTLGEGSQFTVELKNEEKLKKDLD